MQIINKDKIVTITGSEDEMQLILANIDRTLAKPCTSVIYPKTGRK